MTLEEVKARIQKIRDEKGDDEVQHSLEDDLYFDLLKYFADQGNELAKEAIKSRDISFGRWMS